MAKTLGSALILLLCYVFPASAQQVYHDCAAPPTTFRNTWYIDPVNGMTQAAGGNGSAAHPWNWLQALFATETGYAYPLLTSIPYRQVPVPGQPAIVATGPKTGPVKPGDEVLLMSGNYGNIGVSVYDAEIVNTEFVTIAAAPGQTPVLTSLSVNGANLSVFSGLKVQSLEFAALSGAALVQVKDGGAAFPTSNIVFENMTISSQDDATGWSQAQWVANARNGFFAQTSAGGSYAKCVSMTGSHITNVRNGATLTANLMVFSGNEIDHFGDDGLDYGASNLTITKNYVHDNLNLNDGNHNDAMQGVLAPLAVTGSTVNNYEAILIDSNTVIRQTDPNLAFPTYLQGIDAFDDEWSYLTVTNNIVITSACWGIAFSSIHASVIANNTVLSDGLVPVSGCLPAVSVGDKTHEGNSSTNTAVRNNLASAISVYNLDAGVEADHNVGLSVFYWYVGTVGQFFSTPGTIYGNANLIATGGPASEFVNFDPSTLTYNVMLKAGAQAICAGTASGAPTVDILGDARTVPYSAGAYASTYPCPQQ